MRKQFCNKDILENATLLHKIFLESNQEIVLPIKVNFYLQKNIKTFLKNAEEIEEARLKIGEKYGEYDANDNSYVIENKELRQKAQQELKDLLSLDQILEIYTITLEDLQDTKLTVAQMNAMLFMIDEN